jgi:hypothetical protein
MATKDPHHPEQHPHAQPAVNDPRKFPSTVEPKTHHAGDEHQWPAGKAPPDAKEDQPSVKAVHTEEEAKQAAAEAQWPAGKPPPDAPAAEPVIKHRDYGMDPEVGKPKAGADAAAWVDYFLAKHKGKLSGTAARAALLDLLESYSGGKAPPKAAAAADEEDTPTKHDPHAAPPHADPHKKK